VNVTLRSYQLAVVEAILRAARAGSRRLLFQLPTGCGKTETFAELCRLAKFPMVIAPQLTPMEQAKERLELRLGEKCDVEQGHRYVDAAGSLYEGRRRVIVASRDSLLSGARLPSSATREEKLSAFSTILSLSNIRSSIMSIWFMPSALGLTTCPYIATA
jgi:superfamily II DNA or RNA helicase